MCGKDEQNWGDGGKVHKFLLVKPSATSEDEDAQHLTSNYQLSIYFQ